MAEPYLQGFGLFEQIILSPQPQFHILNLFIAYFDIKLRELAHQGDVDGRSKNKYEEV